MKPTEIIASVPAVDGAGVHINRIAGSKVSRLLDPFLMIDEIRSDQSQDYMAGFPAHPHRGFETITYLLRGRMKHEDHLGNQRVMSDGGVQWMTTGKGIIHSEMPEPNVGIFHGFQVWLNLPSEKKLVEPAYYDIDADKVHRFEQQGMKVSLLAGELAVADKVINGAFSNDMRTRATIADIKLPAGAKLSLSVAEQMNLLVYAYQGRERYIPNGHLGVYQGGRVTLEATDELRALVLAGVPLQEPIVQYGPFVMNNEADIEQALRDYAAGRLAS